MAPGESVANHEAVQREPVVYMPVWSIHWKPATGTMAQSASPEHPAARQPASAAGRDVYG